MMAEVSWRVTTSCPARLKPLELRDWGLADPAQLDDAGFRRVHDDFCGRVGSFIRELNRRSRRTLPRAREIVGVAVRRSAPTSVRSLKGAKKVK